jgi:hypothetical protein
MTEIDDGTGDRTDGIAPIPTPKADPWKRPEMPRVGCNAVCTLDALVPDAEMVRLRLAAGPS